MIFTITNWGLVFPTPQGLNVNNPGWSVAEPRVSESRTTTVRANMLLERSGRISVPELVVPELVVPERSRRVEGSKGRRVEGRTEGGGTGTKGRTEGRRRDGWRM